MVYVRATGGITDGSKLLFMEANIYSMGAEEIQQDGMLGRATAEEWVGVAIDKYKNCTRVHFTIHFGARQCTNVFNHYQKYRE